MILALLVFAVASCSKSTDETSIRKIKPVRLSQDTRKLVREKTAALAEPVTLKLFTGSPNEKRSPETRALLQLMGSMTSKIRITELPLSDPEDIRHLETDRGPVTVFEGKSGNRISYYGYPENLELEPFLDSLLITSGQMEPLAASTVTYLEGLEADINIRVFVTSI